MSQIPIIKYSKDGSHGRYTILHGFFADYENFIIYRNFKKIIDNEQLLE